MNKDKSKGTVIEGYGGYVFVMVICILFAEGIVGTKLLNAGEGFIYFVLFESVVLGLYWWILRVMVHKVVDATYNKLTDRTDLTKFRTVDCMKLKGDLSIKCYSYVVSGLFLLSMLKIAQLH
jgi:hypothetical protein